MRKACRQVYEIKAQHTINNLAAYHKINKKIKIPPCIMTGLYDPYIHFKRTSLSSTHIYLMYTRVPGWKEQQKVLGALAEARAGH